MEEVQSPLRDDDCAVYDMYAEITDVVERVLRDWPVVRNSPVWLTSQSARDITDRILEIVQSHVPTFRLIPEDEPEDM